MFYIFELKNRSKYILFSILSLFLVCYINYETIFSILDCYFYKFFTNKMLKNYYIYTHPFELYYTQFFVSVLITFSLTFIYAIWQMYDFFKPSLYYKEYCSLKYYSKLYFSTLILFYCFVYIFVLPFLLSKLFLFSNNSLSNSITVFFELKIYDFISFVAMLNIILIFLFLIIFILICFILNCSISNLLKQKKSFYFLFICLATFLSPPDILSQIVIFILLIIFFEIILLIKFIYAFLYYYGK